MPSPFPGMDPFLELQEWQDFHARLNIGIGDALGERLRPKYVVRVEKRVYLEHPLSEDSAGFVVADLALALAGSSGSAVAPAEPTGDVLTAICELPMPVEHRETYLVIRDREDLEVVTVIETLSPSNKAAGTGRREYLRKREEILSTSTNLVELDLLRGGRRMPTVRPLPPADYYAIVSRGGRRPRGEVQAWTLRSPLPSVPVPLADGDPDVRIDLQEIFRQIYDRAGYDLSLDYNAELSPPLTEAERTWVRAEVLRRPSV